MDTVSKLRSLFDVTLLCFSVWKHKSLCYQLVTRNISSKYKGAFLGVLWSAIQPLMMLCVYTFVFSFVFKARGWGHMELTQTGAYPIIMFCGIAAYNLFSEGVNSSCNLIVSNPNFVKKVIFPLEILVVSQVAAVFAVGFLWFLLVLIGVIAVFHHISCTVLLLPVILLPLLFMTLGLSFLVSSLQVFLRDTRYVVAVLLQMLFYMTPIFYSLDLLPGKWQNVLRLNPLVPVVDSVRDVVVFGKFPAWGAWGISCLTAVIVLQLGLFWFRRTQRGFSDVL